MLTVSQIHKAYGDRTLLRDASLQVNRGDRIGLVGPNGAGKSTLFSLILRENEPDAGNIQLQKGANVGFLPQESAPAGNETVIELALSVSSAMAEAVGILKRPDEFSHLPEDDHHRAAAEFAELDGFNLEAKAKRILSGLAFRESDFDRPARTMSGGWIMRAHLARLLVMEPDLLMLDEPTNHLDLESLGWFQNYLGGYRGAILVISHDRAFLNALCTGIVEIANSRLNRYRGNYDSYVQEKAARQVQQEAAYRNQQREIAALQEFADRFRAKASKASQAQSKLKQIERMERIEAPESSMATVSFRFPQPPRSGQRTLVLSNVQQAYGEKVIYRDLNLTVERGQRTVLVGPNGAGKSTLLKILAGVLPFQAGTRELGHNVKTGYYAQHRIEMLNANRSVLQEAMDVESRVSEQSARTVLGSFLFRGDDAFKPVGVLSGGEKSRLALVKLLLDPPNVLLMDEPTTHLDIGSIDALIGALKQYEGTLIFVSHDVHFIRAIATSVLHIHSGQLTPFAGDYQYYLDKSQAVSERQGLIAGNRAPAPATVASAPSKSGDTKSGMKEIREQRRLEAGARQEINRKRREHEKRARDLEHRIEKLEARQKEITELLQLPETYEAGGNAVALNRELSDIAVRLEAHTADWERETHAITTLSPAE